jgi:predicted permease
MSTSALSRDVRYAYRSLVRTPGFTLIALATFAIGIGVNTAVFSVFNGVLLKPLGYPDADRITMVWNDNRRQAIKEDITSYPNYRDWAEQSQSYAHLAAYTSSSFNLTGADEPERLRGAQVTANFFDVMGLSPLMGRVFTREHETPGKDTVVVLAHGFWQRRFGGRNDVLGQTIVLNGRSHEIIGVMPGTLRVPENAELWKPLAPAEQLRNARASFWLPVIGRLKPGVTVEQAQTEMTGITARLEEAYPSNRGFGAYVVGLHQQIIGDIERSLIVLLAAVSFVLLIACANLGNLMLGRTSARRKELAIRTALGADRWRIVRQIVTETMVLALLGSVIGLVLAYWATGFFVALGSGAIPRAEAVGMDARVLLYTLGLAIVAALLAGLVPALQASRPAVVDGLREGGRESGPALSRGTRSVLIAAEVALAFMLLAGAGILVRTLWNMQQVDRGFRTDHIASATVSLPAAQYRGPAEGQAFYARLLERVRALPGVESAATTTGVLLPEVANSTVFEAEGRPVPPPEQRVEYPYETVSTGYFETLGISLVAGRTFADSDSPEARQVVIVNESLARREWPDQDALGRRIRPLGGDDNSWMTVVGVIRDLRRSDVTRAVRPEMYFPALQSPTRTLTLVVRTAGDPQAIIPALRAEVKQLNPQLPLFATGTLAGQLSETMEQPRFRAVLLAGFAAIALLLAAIGIYGVTAHAVGQRRHEVGIRMALGARGADVLGLMMSQHLKPAIIGIVLGIIGAIGVSRSLESLVFGVAAADPLTLGAMGLTLIVVAALACWVPARRATTVDPLVALRVEQS